MSHLPVYEELIADGELGLLFPRGDAITLAGQLARLVAEPRLRAELRAPGRDAVEGWSETTDELEGIYARVCARRHDPRGNQAIRQRLASRRAIHCDLHMHTDHSPDCATPVPVLLETARERGLGAIAVTDHNEVSGALEARELADGMDGFQVIVAEEVKTAEQGEVIGLFIERRSSRDVDGRDDRRDPPPGTRLRPAPVRQAALRARLRAPARRRRRDRHPRGLQPEDRVLRVQRGGGAVRRQVPDRPRAGSDSHVPQGLGSGRIRVSEFEGPEEFLEAMRDADIIHKHKNLIYVQALKFLQTAGQRRRRR